MNENSVKLYNILFCIFLFNSSVNLREVTPEDNESDAKHEAWIGRTLKAALTRSKKHPDKTQPLKVTLSKQFQEHRDQNDDFAKFLDDKICPHMQRLKMYIMFSGYLTGIFSWFYEIFSGGKELYDRRLRKLKRLASRLKDLTVDGIKAYAYRTPVGKSNFVYLFTDENIVNVYPNLLESPSFTIDRVSLYLLYNLTNPKLKENAFIFSLFEDLTI